MKRTTLGALVLAAIAAIFAVVYSRRGEPVEAELPERGKAVQAVYATGTVEATVMLPIAARSAARLVELNVDEGSEVSKGQVLAKLEQDDLLQEVEEARAREQQAESEYQRSKALIGARAISRDELEKTRANWEAAKAASAAALARASYLTLTAPEDGRIIRRDGEIGELIPANQAVFWLSCCAPLRISAEVDEEDIALVQPGQKVLIRADAFPGSLFEGRVTSITPKGDPVARSYRVRIAFSEETPLMIGMTAETNIVIREASDALLVPSSAVSEGALWIVENGKASHRKVSVGAIGPDKTEIVEGLTDGAMVIAQPSPDLREGQDIRLEGSPES